jgi:hypothetical protein
MTTTHERLGWAISRANVGGYFADLALTEGGPVAQTPEVPVAVTLPLTALGIFGPAVGLRRLRGRASTAR